MPSLTLNTDFVDGTIGGPGLTISQFLGTISDQDVRNLLKPDLLATLDPIFRGRIDGNALRQVAHRLLDFSELLNDVSGRKAVLRLLPDRKRTELARRIGRPISTGGNGGVGWAPSEVKELRDFFGLLDERIVPPSTPVEDDVDPAYGLFSYQRDVVARLTPLLDEGDRRVILHLPTGAGKTRTAMHVVAQWLRRFDPSVVVWLASGKELLEQAHAAFRDAWHHLGNRRLQVATMWGDQMPTLEDIRDGFLVVGLAKAWAVMAREPRSWAARLSPRIRLVVFDEAHQSIATTYQQVTQELTLDYRCSLLGLTATPGRTWADIDEDGRLAEFFSNTKISLLADNPIAYLIDRGYLANPNFHTLLTEPGTTLSVADIARIARNLDIPDDILAHLSVSEQYVTAVLKAVDMLLSQQKQRILVFAATVPQAELLAAILVGRSIQCDVVTARTASRFRENIIQQFQNTTSQPRVLINFGVLATGFDAPRIDALVVARPTRSLVLYSQMVGRAIRGPRAGGTETCDIITVVDPVLPGFGDITKAFLNWEDVWTIN